MLFHKFFFSNPLYQRNSNEPFLQQPQTAYSYYSNPIIQPHNMFQNLLNSYKQTSPTRPLIFCTPLTSAPDNILGSAKDESYINLHQTSSEDVNKTRASKQCPYGEVSCEDNSKCIKIRQRCDDEVHCKDASDEQLCPCKTRIMKSRICDGYIDCPSGEDEVNCFGCELGTFSCDDWSPRERISTCIPIEQRCDGIPQCPTEKDEMDCTALVDSLATKHFMETKIIGFLHRNYQGRWYPVCRNPELWANDACQNEIGPSTVAPLTHLVPIDVIYDGLYVSATSSGTPEIVQSCEERAAVYVECPPLICGVRVQEKNPFRREEVDTSAERILGQIHTLGPLFQNYENESNPILGSSRVVGGKPSQPKAWPWIVSVYRNGVFHCGGALINEAWIVTAAHCVDKYSRYYYEIQAGVLRRYSYSPMVQNRVVYHIIAHQLYDRRKLKNDIALMKISKPIEFNRYVKPICLPSEITAGKNYMWGPEPGTLCTAVGWGATVEHGSDPDHLREVKVPVHKKCKHREDEEGHEICAGLREGGKDACQGDSGGPFMCRNPNSPNQWYLAGIVSHGEGCARPDEPGVYTRVSMFLGWIFEHIRAEILPARRPLHHCPGYSCRKSKKCIGNKRRCDKIVDCLEGDDEVNCERNTFPEIFRNAMRQMFFRSNNVDGVNKTNSTVSITYKANTNKNVTKRENGIIDLADAETDGNMASKLNTFVNKVSLISTSTHTPFISTETEKSKLSFLDKSRFEPISTIINEKSEPVQGNDVNELLNVSTVIPTQTKVQIEQNNTITELSKDLVTTTENPSTSVNNVTASSPLWKFPQTPSLEESKFKCKVILQTISINRVCNHNADCEDATDEQNCTCRDYLKYNFPQMLCDGVTNCLDKSDEENCRVCGNNQHQCRESTICINNNQICDNILDCPLEEDENDCFALTDGKIITLDDDLRPHINKSGVVTINHNGVWQVYCSNPRKHEASIAADICFYLGFSDYNNFMTVPLTNSVLSVQKKNVTIVQNTTVEAKIEKCLGLFIKCSNNIDLKHYPHDSKYNSIKQIETPWNGEIYIDGVYKCTGALLETNWIITSFSCFGTNFSLHNHYVTVLFGGLNSDVSVINPYEQVYRVVDLLQIESTTISLLRIEENVKVTRYVRPIGFDVKKYIVSETRICLAQGADSMNNSNLIYFKPLPNCSYGLRCFYKDKSLLNCGKRGRSVPWSGSIVCQSIHGWYPAAVYYEPLGGCDFPEYIAASSIQYWKATIMKLIKQSYFEVAPPICKGVRCTIGTCVSFSTVCDGVANCRDGVDESSMLCFTYLNYCAQNNTCNCLKSEIKCRNGKCVSKTAFCDHKNDCGDWSDEPEICNCRSYLALTSPDKICDGTRNCLDRSDEDPEICPCSYNSFVCKLSNKCVAQDVVCDGVVDCPNGEDELQCISLISSQTSAITEVQIRTAGVWHPGCFPQTLTTLQLEEICSKMSYTGRSATKLIPHNSVVKHSGLAVTDNFQGIWIRPNSENKLLLSLRDGNEPFVKLKPDINCYRLFLKCL